MPAEERKEGLQHLSDETLAAIVESEFDAYGELRSEAAHMAFVELSKRTPE